MRLIDLDEFLRQNCVDRMEGKTCEECKHHVLEVSCERLMEQPMINPVKHGRWIKAERQGCWSYADVYKQCSECGNVTFLAEKMNYCPNCGADMRGETGC